MKDAEMNIDPGVTWQFEGESSHKEMISACIKKLTTKNIGSTPFIGPRKEKGMPVNHLDIHVSHNLDWMKLRVREDDFYVVGFVNKDGFFEFFPESGKQEDRIEKSSRFLTFKHSYQSMTKACNREMHKIPIGYYSILKAIQGLSRCVKNTEARNVAEWLLTMLIVVPESARFKKICKKVNSSINNKTENEVQVGHLVKLVHEWATYSVNIKLDEDKELKKIKNPAMRNHIKANAAMARKQVTLGIDTEVDAMIECKNIVLDSWGTDSLLDCDKEVSTLIDQENNLQRYTLELAASENFTSEAVCEALGSPLVNKYVGGIPGKRYGGGNVFIDEIENLCKSRALELFGLDPAQWSVNVQPYSSSGANFALYMALLEPNNHIMGLDVLSGGNVSHGYCTNSEKVSAASIYFSSLSYKISPQTGYVDYEELEKEAMKLKPKLIICGGNAYPRDWDYARFRSIANKCSALLLCDMGHLSGLVAAKVAQTPFDHCDVVTAPTNMILRGPPSCVIFYRKGLKDPRNVNGVCYYEDRINSFVSPSQQGGPHANLIAAIGVTFKLAMMPNFRNYAEKVKVNAVALGQHLKKKGYLLVTGGTDSDILLWDLRPLGLTGDDVAHICGMCNISLKKCPLLGDRNPIALGGILIGTAAMTSRGMGEEYLELVSMFLHKAVRICILLKMEGENLKLVSIKKNQDLVILRKNILALCRYLYKVEHRDSKEDPTLGLEGSDLSDYLSDRVEIDALDATLLPSSSPITADTSSSFDSNSAAL